MATQHDVSQIIVKYLSRIFINKLETLPIMNPDQIHS